MQSKDYRILNVQPLPWEPDKYGNKTYQIDVEGHDGPLLWKTSKEPERGQIIYGHTQLSASGKAMMFKRDSREEGYQPSRQASTPTPIQENLPQISKPQYSDDRQNEIRYAVCIKAATDYLAKNEPDLNEDTFADGVVKFADTLYKQYRVPTTEAEKMFGPAQDLQ